MEIQNSVTCLEPMSNKTDALEAFFMPCTSSPKQKWDFVKVSNNEHEGQIIHKSSNKCLSFNKIPEEKAPDTRYSKVKLLHFLSNVVNEVGLTIDSPVLETCEKDQFSSRYKSQLWSIDSPVNLINK